jgi:hypothetical protein
MGAAGVALMDFFGLCFVSGFVFVTLVLGRDLTFCPFWLVRAHVAQAVALSSPVEYKVV